MNGPAPAAPHPGEGHRGRLRERFLAHGLAKFTDEELLELLLTLATPRRDCKQPARQLMARFGSLQAVLDASPGELAQVEGIVPKNLLGLKLVPAAAKRYLEDRLLKGLAEFSPERAADYLRLTMGPLGREVFRVLLLDGHRRVLAADDLTSGTLNQAVVYPREVAARALAGRAAAVVCAHNHPGGDPRPSPQDERLTRLLYFALKGVGVELLDHLVVTRESVHSFAARGALAALAAEYRALDLW